MTREAYHKALKELENELLLMGDMVAKAMKDSIEALQKRDFEVSKGIIKNDLLINKKRFEIEERCLQMIATQQPMAIDLRTIAAIFSIIADLERMGDHAEGNAKINIMIGEEPLIKPLVDIPRMGEIGIAMLEKSLRAFMERDVEAARSVCNE